MRFLIASFILFVTFNCYSQKQVAITFDDLPMANPKISLEHTIDVNNRILKKLNREKIKATGFVNESEVAVLGEKNSRTDMLRKWVANGHALGNHTYSHPNYNTTPFEEYVMDIQKGEDITRAVLKEKKRPLKYFRHPFQATGATAESKYKLDTFLINHNYTVVLSTVESSDFVFHLIYLKAKLEKDSATANTIAKEYLKFTEARFDYYEKLAVQVVGRQVKHVFLCHVNELNADYIGSIIIMLRNRGYQFITLEEALKDEVYQRPDEYIGEKGISWLQRWNTENRQETIKLEPKVDEKIREKYNRVGKSKSWIIKAKIKGHSNLVFGGTIAFLLLLSATIFILKRKKKIPVV